MPNIHRRRRCLLPILLGASLSAAAAFLGGADGLAIMSRDDSMVINHAATPANAYVGTPGNKVTTTRASGAMRWNEAGNLELVGNGVLRRDFDPRLSATVERCGYLIEEARTNLALRSEDFGNAAWTKSELTVSSDAATAPDGSVNFDKFIPSTNAANHTAIQSPTTTAAAYSMSFFAKAAGYNFIYCRLYNNDGSPLLKGAWFNLGTGTVGTTESGITASIVSVGNGVYRCVATLATAYNGAGNSLILGVSNADNTTSFTGDGTSGVLIFGAQLELGSFASSYIPTAGSTVTRAADQVSLAGTLFPLNQSEGTLYAKFGCIGVPTSVDANILTVSGATAADERHSLARLTSRKTRFQVIDGTANVVVLDSTGTVSDLTQAKVAGAYKADDSAAAMIGETVQSDNTCTMPTTTHIIFGNRASDGARALNGWLFEAAYFPTRKTNSQLQALASGYASDALLLMGAETQGLTFAATDQSMSILDTGTPANAYSGELSAKLGSIRTSAGMTYLSSGLLGWGPENLDIQSQAFDNASWTESNCTLTDLQADGPRGALTMASYVESTSGARMSNAANRPAIAGVTYTVSRVFKRLNCDWVAWYIGDDLTPTNGMRVWFNLATGAAGSNTSQGSGWTFTSAAVTDVGSGAYRLSVTFVAGGNIAIRHQTASADANTGRADVGSGAGVGSGFYIDMAQTEKASSASTYKPTTSAAYYGLRLDYDSRLSGGPGYLVEEARTNLNLQTNAYTNAAWTAASGTAAEDISDGPMGAATMARYTESGASAFLHCANAVTVANGSTYTTSVYLKRGNHDWIRLIAADNSSFSNGVRTWFNLSTGVVGTSSTTGSGWTAVSAAIHSVGGGVYRCSITYTTGATTLYVATASAAADNTATRADVGSGAGVGSLYYLDCYQTELGAFATSYIPTTSATVTRAADIPVMLTSALPFSATAGTFVGRFSTILGGTNPTTLALLAFDDGSSAESITMFVDNSAGLGLFQVIDGGVSQATPNQALGKVSGTVYGMAAGWAANDFATSINGGTIQTDASGTLPTVTKLNFGGRATGVQLNGWLRHGRYFPTRKSNADLAVLAAAA